MEIQNTRKIASSLPLLTIAVLGVSIAVFLSPEEWLFLMRYDRAAILHGEFWRIFTGHTVHFSGNHLLWDLSVFAVLGWVLEGRERRCDYGILLFVMALCIGGGLLLLTPGMRYYGGLSGLACGVFVSLALSGIKASPALRPVWGAGICVLVAKIAFEASTRHSIFYTSDAVLVMWESHAIGSLIAAIFFIRKKISLPVRP